jgi:hypothetical protein
MVQYKLYLSEKPIESGRAGDMGYGCRYCPTFPGYMSNTVQFSLRKEIKIIGRQILIRE